MTVGELFRVSPQCWLFIRLENGEIEEYTPRDYEESVVESVFATEYPMFKNVLEVTIAK